MAFALALLFALAPVVNDLCTLGCERPQAPSCPLHGTSSPPPSDHCGHDHSVLRADLTRAAPLVAPLVALSFDAVRTVAAPIASPAPTPSASSPAPPDRIARTAILRI